MCGLPFNSTYHQLRYLYIKPFIEKIHIALTNSHLLTVLISIDTSLTAWRLFKQLIGPQHERTPLLQYKEAIQCEQFSIMKVLSLERRLLVNDYTKYPCMDFYGVNEIPTIVSNFYKKLILTIGLFRWLIIIQCYCYKKSVRQNLPFFEHVYFSSLDYMLWAR